jgi:oxygen-independent coproporphyrinogen-3 oxidase
LLEALKTELTLQKSYLDKEIIDTIYFGGGTPSLLEIQELEAIINDIYKNFNINNRPEITIEANPDDLSARKTQDFKQAGFNRLSIGAQSFDDKTLRYLNRLHNSEDSLNAIKHAEKAGFDNINLDLIFAITENHESIVKNDISVVLQLQPQHVSTYSLTLEPRTVFGNWRKKGRIQEVTSDEAASEFEYIIDSLVNNGYEHYEVSNFSKPGYISKHNSNYWKHIPYLGIGPSAHSFNGTSRQSNVNNNSRYIKSIEKKIIPAEIDYLSHTDRINEQILTGLRTKWGVDLFLIKKKYGVDIERYNKSYIQNLVYHDLATFYNGKLQLLKKGMLIADKICSDLFFSDKNG